MTGVSRKIAYSEEIYQPTIALGTNFAIEGTEIPKSDATVYTLSFFSKDSNVKHISTFLSSYSEICLRVSYLTVWDIT